MKIIDRIVERMGYPPDFDPGTIEELHESMRQSGIRAEDNEFSRAIIEEREIKEAIRMEKATLETVIKRIDRLERTVVNMNLQISSLVKELVPNATENCKTSEELTQTDIKNDESDAHIVRKIFAEIYEKMGISPDFELRPLEELRESMRQHGIRAEDNEFSRAIIEEREK